MGEPAVGDILAGKYEVRGVLGRGGMGVVLSAWHVELGQKVALKCLLPHALLVSEVVERFAREARAAAKIKGEHVVRVLDVGKLENGTPYMVMEHLEGHDLAVELARRGRFSVHEAVRFVLETCEALAQSHLARIVHRDLKPSNLYLAETPGRRPIIKVLDFGISKIVDPDSDAITKTATVIGTAHYMSPEQLLSAKSVDMRSDLWALGIILHQLLVGQPPFLGESAPEVIAKIIKNEPPAVRSLRDDVPAGLEAVIQRCLRTEPRERFAHVGELAAALAPFAAPEDTGSVTAIQRVIAESGTALGAIDSSAESLPIAAATPATPLEIASTVHAGSMMPGPLRRRWMIAGAAALLVLGGAAFVASSARREVITAAPDASPIASPASAPLAIASIEASAPSASVAVAPTACAAPSVSAPRPLGAPRPRPVASATRPAGSASSAPSAPTASATSGQDPLDIPLR